MIVAVVIAAVATGLACMSFGFLLGYNMRQLHDRIEILEQNSYDREIEEQPGSAIIDTSPKAVRAREAPAGEEDSEAQIIRTKSPQQMRADHERRDKEELDRITNGAIR